MSRDENYLTKLIKELNIDENQTFNAVNEVEVEKNDFNKVDLHEDDGFIEVRDHQIFIISPNLNGKKPVLIPNPKVKILLNGTLLKKERVVFEADEILWEVPNKTEYKILTSKDNLFVNLQLYPLLFTLLRLKNKKRSNRFIIETEIVQKTLDTENVVSQISEAVLREVFGLKLIRLQ
ncbi:hypothetical protein RJD24_21295 [Bacillaceae bacterium IKA-2]|nr:hypothetical protein RJD24_21295 [Bacillaceae bacterium IKA-2]